MERLQVLFVAPYPPGHVRSRSFHLLRHLLTQGHSVSIACPDSRDGTPSRLDELRRLGARTATTRISSVRSWVNALGARLRRRPMQSRTHWSPRLVRRVREELSRTPFDVLHVEHLRATCYALGAADILERSPTARVWDSVGCFSELMAQASRSSPSPLQRLLARLETQPTRRYERRMVQGFDRVLLASDADLEALAAAIGRSPRRTPAASLPPEGLGLLPNGVDCERFPFRDPLARQAQVVFAGSMHRHANAAAARFLVERVMPRVWSERPDVAAVLVGPSPPRALRALAAKSPERIRVTGWVPEVAPFVATAAVSVAPLPYRAGSQLKVLEAMACGTAVVADAGTCGAIGASAGRELLVAETEGEFAAAILRLLVDTDLRRRLAETGRDLVERHFSWARIAPELEAHYDEAMTARRRRRPPVSES